MMSSLSASRATTKLFLFYCFFTSIHDLACADPPYSICSTNNSYAVGSPFEKNLKTILISLSSNASVSNFHNTSAGFDLETVYGLYLCLDYDIIENCKNCITTATQDIKKLCPNSKEAVVWEETCQLRYSNERFFGQLDVSENIPLNNTWNYSELTVFTPSVNALLSNLTRQATLDPSANMYATGKLAFTDRDILYALVQCTRDLSADDCNTCLQTAKANISSCCYFSVGARLLSRSCYLRYELYPFSEGKNETSVPNSKIHKGSQRKTWVIVTIAILLASLALAILGLCIRFLVMRHGNQESDDEISEIQLNVHCCNNTNNQDQNFEGGDRLKAQNIPYFDLESIHAATDNFSDLNFLGQGGFGPVYKGIMRDGREVAVKRLSSCSEQGSIEFTNEVLLIMKLQHRNLVRLLGFCVDKEEKLLVYEYMPNSSLDVMLFDKRKRSQLNWSRRLNIINGIARGILYLHEDSRLRIIHRDLKASNVLLDSDMNPKISDFGMARIFAENEGEANTVRIVGTYGYMAPEYAMEGFYSIKSDVFSFGVLLIEIITGRRNADFHLSKRAPSLLAYAWKLRNEGQELELVDPLLTDTYCPDELIRYVHIGLLCVQEDPCDRPTMSSVVLMLKSETVTLGQPERPAFYVGRFTELCETTVFGCSINGLTISDVAPG